MTSSLCVCVIATKSDPSFWALETDGKQPATPLKIGQATKALSSSGRLILNGHQIATNRAFNPLASSF